MADGADEVSGEDVSTVFAGATAFGFAMLLISQPGRDVSVWPADMNLSLSSCTS